MLYVDASALVPLYTPEKSSSEIEQMVMAADEVAVSDLTIAESKNAIIRKGRRGELMLEDVEMALQAIDTHLAERRFYFFEMQRAFMQQVPTLSQEAPVHLRTLDALHLAAALALKATAMATYDLDLAQAARARSIAILGAR